MLKFGPKSLCGFTEDSATNPTNKRCSLGLLMLSWWGTTMDTVVVKKNGKLYKSIWISSLVLKCGSCFRGVISPYFEKKTECKVCGARIVYEPTKRRGVLDT